MAAPSESNAGKPAEAAAIPGTFSKEKEECLKGDDRSRKGEIDSDIVEIVELINENERYFTTSSCSGRIVVFCHGRGGSCEEDSAGGLLDGAQPKKKGCQWLLVSHELVQTSDVLETINKYNANNPQHSARSSAILKFEPFVMHVRCATLQDAQKLHTRSLEAGFRNSGLTINKNGRITLAVRSTQTLEIPLTDGEGRILVSTDYVDFVVDCANKKFLENRRRVRKFHALLEQLLKSASS